jgi:gluconokinase
VNILVIDVGSSSVRALVFDESLRVTGQASSPVRFTTAPAGAATMDAETLRQITEDCIDRVMKAAPPIQIVGMATYVGNLLGVDQDGRAITPIYSYADTRSAPDVEALRDETDIQAAHQRTGAPHHSAYHAGRLRWLKRSGQHAAQWIDLATYLYRCWFGRVDVPCSYSVASWSGLLNRETLRWDDQWLRALEIELKQLAPLADFSAVQRGLAPEYARRWSALRDVPFTLAVGDGAAANVGSGALEANTATLTIGTTAALRCVSTETLPSVPQGLWGYRIDAARHLIGGATSEGGNLHQWLKQTVLLPQDAETQLARRDLDAHGLTFLPLLAGERSPGWRADATGTLHGIRFSTTPLDMLQAAMEGVALRLGQIAAALNLPDRVQIMAGGGALHASSVWARMCAAALNRPLHLLAEAESTARGVAILAREVLGVRDAPPPAIARMIEPMGEDVQRMRAAGERQRALYGKLYG